MFRAPRLAVVSVLDGIQGDIVATGCLVLEQPFAIHVLPAPGSLPVYLIGVLIFHVLEEVAAHEVVVKIGFVSMGPVDDELIRQSIDEQPANRDRPLTFPRPHHSTQWNQIAVTDCVPRSNRGNLGFRVGCFPTSTVVCVWEREAVVSVCESRDNLKSDAVGKGNAHDLTIRPNARGGVRFLDRCAYRLKECRLPVALIVVVLDVLRIRQREYHVEVAEATDRCVTAVRTDVQAVGRVGRCGPEVSIEASCDCLVAIRNGLRVPDLNIRAKRAEPCRDAHAFSREG